MTVHRLPCHDKALMAERRSFIQLRDKGILDVKLLDILWEPFLASKQELLGLMVKFGLFVPLNNAAPDAGAETTAALAR